MSLYQVSKANTVVSFNQNRKAPHKVGEAFVEKMRELVIAGETFDTVKKELSQMHAYHQDKNTRGIASVGISFHDDSEFEPEQPCKCIYLSYKLNGSFAIFTEYMPFRIDGHSDAAVDR